MKSSKTVLACITAQEHCIKIIEAAKDMSERIGCRLVVLTVQPKKSTAAKRSKDVKILQNLSKTCKEDIVIRYCDNAVAGVAKEALRLNPIHIFVGEDNGFMGEFRRQYGLCPISMVTNEVVCTIPPELEMDKTMSNI